MADIAVKLDELTQILSPLLALGVHNAPRDSKAAFELMPLLVMESRQAQLVLPLIDQHYLDETVAGTVKLGGKFGVELVVKVLRKVQAVDDIEHAEVMLRIAKLKQLVQKHV